MWVQTYLRRKKQRYNRNPGWVMLVGGLWPSLAALAADPVPPPPNPADPVNYLQWFNETLGGDIADNAADLYIAAYRQMPHFQGDGGSTLQGPWDNNLDMSSYLANQRTGLEKVREAAQRSACYFPLEAPPPTGDARADGALLSATLPWLRSHGNATKALIAGGYGDWAGGNHRTLFKESLWVIRAGHHLDNSPMLMGRLVGLSSAALGYSAIRKGLSLAPDADDQAAQLLPELEKVDPPAPGLGVCWLRERVGAWDLCQRLFVPGSEPGTWTIHRPALGVLDLVDQAGTMEPKLIEIGFERTRQEFDTYYDGMRKWLERPYYQGKEEAYSWDARLRESSNPLIQKWPARIPGGRMIYERIVAQRRATRLIVHLFVHHGKTGGFPESLEELKAPDLAEIRLDSFSGRDFLYKKTEEAFQLYSIADNLKDDGGQHNSTWAEGDFVFWPVQE